MPRRTAPGAPLECEVRPATAYDLPEMVEIWGELARYHARLDSAFALSRRWREEYRQFMSGLMGREDARAVVGAHEGEIIGFAVGRISLLPGFFENRRRGYIHDVVTREPYRRRGVARRLVDALLDWMDESGVSMVELTVAVNNPEAIAFWTRLGFVAYMHHFRRDLG